MIKTKFTPGPWSWRVNKQMKQVYLKSHSLIVMDFVRYGMAGAAPRFLDQENMLVRGDEISCVIPGEEHHAKWRQTINHPDAVLIAAAPDMYEALELLENASQSDLDNSQFDGWIKLKIALRKARGEGE